MPGLGPNYRHAFDGTPIDPLEDQVEKVNRYIEFPTIVRKPEIMAAGSLHLLYVKLNIHTMMIEYAESAKRK